MKRGDLRAILIIGAAVGLLSQPILANTPLAGHLNFPFRLAVFFGFLIFAPFALFIAKLISRRAWGGIYQFAQFAAVGTLNSFIDVGILNLETFLNGTSNISNGLFAAFKAFSFLCATTNSFVWNKYWTFSDNEKARAGQVTLFYTIALIGWALNVSFATFIKSIGPTASETAIRIWVNIVAPLAGIAASFLWNFSGYKYWVFKKKK